MKDTTISEQDTALLRRTFNAVSKFDDNAFNEILPYWITHKVGRKKLLTSTGETERYLYFVTEGVQRAYCHYQGKDATIVLFYAYSFAGIIDSFLLQQPSGMYFETLTASRLLKISYLDFMRILEKHPGTEKWLRVVLTHVLSGVLERQKELSVYSAADKLQAVFNRNPALFNLIPHKYLASYIGVDPATFSKLYSQLSNQK